MSHTCSGCNKTAYYGIEVHQHIYTRCRKCFADEIVHRIGQGRPVRIAPVPRGTYPGFDDLDIYTMDQVP